MTGQRPARRRKTMIGRVVSDKMDKTIVVAVERRTRHRVYKRVIRLTSKFQAHDEENTARLGDRVLIEESRPLSRQKRWRLAEIVTRAGAPIELAVEEPETTEAISMAAHPGKRRAAEAGPESVAEETTTVTAADQAPSDEASPEAPAAEASAEAVAEAGAAETAAAADEATSAQASPEPPAAEASTDTGGGPAGEPT